MEKNENSTQIFSKMFNNNKGESFFSFVRVFAYLQKQAGGPLMVAQWLRYCATNRKVAGSIPDGVIGIFHRHIPSDRTMALGSTQHLTEMSTRSISWV
jgi:hypothetical protein